MTFCDWRDQMTNPHWVATLVALPVTTPRSRFDTRGAGANTEISDQGRGNKKLLTGLVCFSFPFCTH